MHKAGQPAQGAIAILHGDIGRGIDFELNATAMAAAAMGHFIF